MERVEDYIVFINIGTSLGNGVIVGNYLITSGHIICEGRHIDIICFRFKGNEYFINKSDSLVCNYCAQEKCGPKESDVAIYDIGSIVEGLNSPLSLSDSNPINGDTLLSISCEEVAILPENKGKPYTRKEYKTDGKVFEIEGNFFRCQMSKPLNEGRSGSPVIKDNVMLGILYGGINPDLYLGKECLFQSSMSIVQLIRGIV